MLGDPVVACDLHGQGGQTGIGEHPELDGTTSRRLERDPLVEAVPVPVSSARGL